jgi:hypothetical protein
MHLPGSYLNMRRNIRPTIKFDFSGVRALDQGGVENKAAGMDSFGVLD